MSDHHEIEASIVIVAYNSANVLRDCLLSVSQSLDISAEVIVVDNASPDDSGTIARQVLPSASVIRVSKNEGFGAGCNAGAAIARGHYLVFLNPDTVVEPGWLAPLVGIFEDDETIGIATSKIVLMDNPSQINTCGNEVHFTGFPSCHLLGADAAAIQQVAEVTSVSGAAFAIKRELFKQINGFDTEFFMYLEDNDLSWRLRLAGYRCVYVPASVVRHRYRVNVSAEKYYYLERNRYQLLLKNLKTRALLAIGPALALAEATTWVYALMRGPNHLRLKLRAISEAARRRAHWRHAHLERAGLFKNTNSALLRACTTHIDYGVIQQGWLGQIASATLNPFYRLFFAWALTALRNQ